MCDISFHPLPFYYKMVSWNCYCSLCPPPKSLKCSNSVFSSGHRDDYYCEVSIIIALWGIYLLCADAVLNTHVTTPPSEAWPNLTPTVQSRLLWHRECKQWIQAYTAMKGQNQDTNPVNLLLTPIFYIYCISLGKLLNFLDSQPEINIFLLDSMEIACLPF